MTTPVRVGLIGYGYAGRTFHAPLISSVPGLQLRIVASRDATKVHADWPDVRVLADPHALIKADDLDLVVIATPNETHAPLARAALSAGKHVVVDKPFTLDLAEARDLLAQAAEGDRLLSVFHNRRWDSGFLAVRQAIETGKLGRVAHFECHVDRFRPHVRDRWREGNGPGAGLWYDLGPHLIDQALVLFGLPHRVHTMLGQQRAGALSDDWAHAVLDYGDALKIILHASVLVASGSPQFVVHGERGSLIKPEADIQEAQLKARVTPGAPGWGIDPDPLLSFSGDDEPDRDQPQALPVPAGCQQRYYIELRDAILGKAANPVPPAQALAVMAVLEAGFISNREQRAVAPAFSDNERASYLNSVYTSVVTGSEAVKLRQA